MYYYTYLLTPAGDITITVPCENKMSTEEEVMALYSTEISRKNRHHLIERCRSGNVSTDVSKVLQSKCQYRDLMGCNFYYEGLFKTGDFQYSVCLEIL